jgi:hypothetical protein
MDQKTIQSFFLSICFLAFTFNSHARDKDIEVRPERASPERSSPERFHSEVELEKAAQSDLFGVSKGVFGAGFVVSSFLNPDNSLRTKITSNSCFGGCETYFDGTLKMYKSTFNGQAVIELRDKDVDASTVIRLVPGKDDQLVKLKGKTKLGELSTLNCTPNSNLNEIFSQILKSK